jgi:hypothetical protein
MTSAAQAGGTAKQNARRMQRNRRRVMVDLLTGQDQNS